MTPEQTAALVAAVITLLVTINAAIGVKVQRHDVALNGTMDQRIDQRAKAIVANDHALRAESPSPASNVATQARVAALVAELQALDPAVLATTVAPPATGKAAGG